jgi:hypothetical protein
MRKLFQKIGSRTDSTANRLHAVTEAVNAALVYDYTEIFRKQIVHSEEDV